MAERKKLTAEFCVVGAGLAGMCAALAAARSGIKTVLMHDRSLPGGNASSEIRMWVCGARGENLREGGIIEELLLENLYRNPGAVPALWDSVLYGALEYEKNLTLLLNCACQSASVLPDGSIASVCGYQTTTQTFITVEAGYFADCSGDSVLAPLCGAEYRHGREAVSEFGESLAQPERDRCTMGSSCLFQARQLRKKTTFTPPVWAKKFRSPEELPPYRGLLLEGLENFWWMETGGLGDTIADTEEHRHELLELALGIWDYLKNYAPEKEKNAYWQLDWLGFLPGKRESRRYVGDYIVTQQDVQSGGNFPDVIAYGGWTLDDHHPGGFYYPGMPTEFIEVKAPYALPYRALYSVNVPNLFCAGRNISVSHTALSSTRVMATCAILGQACGTAAALAVRNALTPREVGTLRIKELQQLLLENDCFLPGVQRQVPELTMRAALQVSNRQDGEVLRNGFDRGDQTQTHCWSCQSGDTAEYRFESPQPVKRIRLVLDSDLNRPEKNIVALRTLDQPELKLPSQLLKSFVLSYQLRENGKWYKLAEFKDNHRRLIILKDLDIEALAVKLTVKSCWGKTAGGVFSFDLA
ncbi:MAG: FAD-dependent oxidoreductase [Lentisphaerae bacterium]|nr:FAD-dependent oxidoreductase [Lentisphaerota bacterium]